MCRLRIEKSSLHGSIAIPPSKSQTLRAILFASLGLGKTRIYNYLASPDTLFMIDACRSFGAKIQITDTMLEIEGLDGKIETTEDVINAGNSGIILRFCAGLGALSRLPVVITGDISLRHRRPMLPLIEAFSSVGVRLESMRGDGFAPIIIKGPFMGGKATLLGCDSQHVSAFLIAAAFAQNETELTVQAPGETPWVEVTLDWFERLRIKYERKGFERFKVFGNSSYHGFEYTVPGDVSSAAYPLAAALITNSELMLTNVDMQDAQGDKALISLFQKMGADITLDQTKKSLHVKPSSKLSAVDVDINNFIDALPILAVVACFAEGKTVIRNAAVARQKECDRISATAKELRKMGAKIEEHEDGLSIQKSYLHGADLDTYEDHRMALSLAVASLATGSCTLGPVSCVSKTFPQFFEELERMGGRIQ